jgi:hypothetical protein
VDPGEISHEIRPRDRDPSLVQTPLQIHFQAKRKEADNDVTDGGVIALMVDGPHLQGTLLLPEGTLYPPKTLVGQGNVTARIHGLILSWRVYEVRRDSIEELTAEERPEN